jgi:hypothetical protein
MHEPTFVAYYCGDDDGDDDTADPAGWYSTANPQGLDTTRDDWATRYDPLRMGPFDTEEEAELAIEEFLALTGFDVGATQLAAKHAQETLEADQENYPGAALAKRRFQVSVKAFASACGQGNPPAVIVGLAAGSLFVHLCAAYPTAGAEVFRRIGNLFRQSLNIPNIEYGEEPTYED